jgi:hypothetical protein
MVGIVPGKPVRFAKPLSALQGKDQDIRYPSGPHRVC